MTNRITIPQPLSIITITGRKCRSKVQPHIQCGASYIVKRVEYLHNGSPVLVVADNRKKSELRINSERFEWKLAEKKELQERAFKDEVKSETEDIMNNFSFDEHVQIAFTPLVISHLAFHYAKQCREQAAANKISILRPLSRSLEKLHTSYIESISLDLNREHRQQIEEQSDKFLQTYAWDFQVLWFSVNAELKRVHPNYPFLELRTDALCGVIMVDMLYQHNRRADKMIAAKLGRPTNTITNPKMASLRHLLMGYAGEADKFNFKAANVALSQKILLKRIYEIQFELKNDVKQ